ncbi:MAG: DUF502 domain-containing protein [Nocardiopsis sp. BM-2018]|nr:MAG: DUF502 domain-containing protein [Nocardiopsis sp. BM-2018]
MASKKASKKKSARRIRREALAAAGPVGRAALIADTMRRYFSTGLLVWFPLIVTLWVCWWVFTLVAGTIDAVFLWAIALLRFLGARNETLKFLVNLEYSLGLALLITAALFIATGFLARYLAARKIISFGEDVLARIPLISRVYRAVQQIRDVFINREGAVFQQTVLVDYPRKGCLVVGFVTSAEHGIVQEVTGEDLTAVFVPTTPNPTSGFLLYVKTEEMIVLDISVEDAMKLIVSGGAYLPPYSGGKGSAPSASSAPPPSGDPRPASQE